MFLCALYQGECKDILSLTLNLVKFNSAYLDPDIVSKLILVLSWHACTTTRSVTVQGFFWEWGVGYQFFKYMLYSVQCSIPKIVIFLLPISIGWKNSKYLILTLFIKRRDNNTGFKTHILRKAQGKTFYANIFHLFYKRI